LNHEYTKVLKTQNQPRFDVSRIITKQRIKNK